MENIIGTSLIERAKAIRVKIVIEQIEIGYRYISLWDNRIIISIGSNDDGYAVDCTLGIHYRNLSKNELLRIVTQIIERLEEEFKNKPSDKEIFDELMNKISIPSGISLVSNEKMDMFIKETEAGSDGFRGQKPSLICFKIEEKANVDHVIEIIADWIDSTREAFKKSRLLDDSRFEYEVMRKCRDYLNVHKYLILIDKKTCINDASRETCSKYNISFGYLLENEYGYYDLMEDIGYKLEYEEEWGMCDDAATYISWSWRKA